MNKRAIDCIHECINAMLDNEFEDVSDLDKFADKGHNQLTIGGFNSILFGTFTNIVGNINGDADPATLTTNETRLQVLSIFSTFIEKCPKSIGTGWKEFFKILKASEKHAYFRLFNS